MMRGAALVTATCAALTGIVPASADEPATVITSTDTTFVMRDERGDQDVEGSTTGNQRRAADVLRVRVWQEGSAGYVRVSLRGSVRARSVRLKFGELTLVGRDAGLDPEVSVFFQRARSRASVVNPDGSQILCRRRDTQVSNRGRTITMPIPTRCRWNEVDRIFMTMLVDGQGDDSFASDFVYGTSQLAWQ